MMNDISKPMLQDLSYDSKSTIIGFRKRLVGVYDRQDKCVRFDYSMCMLGIVDKKDLVIEDVEEKLVLDVVNQYLNLTEEKWQNWQKINQI